ncbi:hypothetical protein KY290_036802 [Solanum tuberosum]|uniref:Uncharacterized protein n=1 Tax=Solanum tuberosum TaxID=4113 RepID=A0ABQ7TTR0_SOLTU|nr:hypothetical protein KY290_036802 [Solanum tuberosum]
MTRTRSMASMKSSDHNSSGSITVNILSSSNSSDDSLVFSSPSFKQKVSSVKNKKDQKKPCSSAFGFLSPEDMQRFWGVEKKNMYDDFKSRPIVPGKVFNLRQLGDSHCPPDDFEVSLEGAKIVVDEPDADLSDFCPLSICFATTLLPTKGFLSSISTRVSTTLLLQDIDELKICLLAVEHGLDTLQDVVENVFCIQKDTSTNVGKLRIAMTGIKQEGIFMVNRLIKQVDSLKGGVRSSNNDLAVSV